MLAPPLIHPVVIIIPSSLTPLEAPSSVPSPDTVATWALIPSASPPGGGISAAPSPISSSAAPSPPPSPPPIPPPVSALVPVSIVPVFHPSSIPSLPLRRKIRTLASTSRIVCQLVQVYMGKMRAIHENDQIRGDKLEKGRAGQMLAGNVRKMSDISP